MKKIIFLLPCLFTILFFAPAAQAFCPVCTIAVGAGVGLSRYLGIDDLIIGLWIGALCVSLIGWTINWLKGRNKNFKGSILLAAIFWYGLIIVPLFFTGIMGHALNKLWGIDKLLLGIAFGTVVFYLANMWYQGIKRKNGGHAKFPLQKVVWPVGALLLASLVLYFVI
ncbi:MAG: hypothetical protein PHT40_04590 [Patescibacteria group bacterium]|nr:hypothetical protein [Patescibacteria group bacterium]